MPHNTIRSCLAAVALMAVSPNIAAAEEFAEASSPHYELIAPATHNSPARYAYYPHGDNPHYGTGYADEPRAVHARRSTNVLTRPVHAGRCAPRRCRGETFGNAVAVGAGRTVGWALARGVLSLF